MPKYFGDGVALIQENNFNNKIVETIKSNFTQNDFNFYIDPSVERNGFYFRYKATL